MRSAPPAGTGCTKSFLARMLATGKVSRDEKVPKTASTPSTLMKRSYWLIAVAGSERLSETISSTSSPRMPPRSLSMSTQS